MSRYYNSYDRLAKIYTRKDGIRLVVRGNGFMVPDEKTIVIAEIPEALNKELHDPSLAGLLHECGHILHSDLKRYQNEPMYKTHGGLINNIEDIRLLNLGRKKYLGYDGLQRAGMNFIRDYNLIPALKSKGSINVSTLLGVCLQFMESGMDCHFFPPKILEMAKVAEKFVKKTKWKPGKAGHLQAEEIATKIIEEFKIQKEKREEEEEKEGKGKKSKGDENKGKGKKRERGKKGAKEEDNDSSSPDRKPDKEEGKGDIEGKGGRESGKDEEKDEEECDSASSGGEDSDSRESEGDGGSLQGEEEGSFDPEDDYESLLQKAIEGSGGQDQDAGLMDTIEGMITNIINKYKKDLDMHSIHPEVIPYDEEEVIDNPLEAKKVDDSVVKKYKDGLGYLSAETDKEVQKLRARILPLLFAEKRSSFLYEQDEGLLDDGGLYKLRVGNGKIYRQRVPGKKTDTVVTLLNDVSGSMVGRKIEMLKLALLTVADTLNLLKIPFEILTFNTGDSLNIPFPVRMRLASSIDLYNRIEPVNYRIIKSFNQNYLTRRHLITDIEPGNYNGDNEAVVWAAKRMLERREKRKILFVLCDGMPNLEYSDNDILYGDLRKNINEIERAGVEVIGGGILTSAPGKFYSTSFNIDSVNDIAFEVHNALFEKLINRKPE